jgi:aminoglycoside phosphotransferase (APT) family kinase protein
LLVDRLALEIKDRTGVALEVTGMVGHGDSSNAAYVRLPEGGAAVLTRPPVSAGQTRLTAEILDLARSRGLPVPRYLLVVPLADGGVAVVQERLPGDHVRWVDVYMVEAMVAVNDRFAGLLSGRQDVPAASLYLEESAPDHPRHESLEGYSDRTRRLLDWIREIGADLPSTAAGDDLLHLDYARGNVLCDSSGRITGVVDWNLGAARGDRNLALVWLRSDLEWSAMFPPGQGGVEPAAIARLDRLLEERVEPGVLWGYWAHWSLVRLHWLILDGHRNPIELFLRLAEHRLELAPG